MPVCPLALAEGRYDQAALLHVTAAGPTFVSEDRAVSQQVWTLTVENAAFSENEQLTVRLLAPEEKGRLTLWRWQGKSWQPVDHEQNGRYLLTTMPAGGASFCLEVTPRAGAPWLAAAIAGVGILLAAFVWHKLRSKAGMPQEEEPVSGNAGK